MKRLALLLFAACVTLAVTAQPPAVGTLYVPVVNPQQTKLTNATVELLRSTDSSLVKAGITDSTGMAAFENISAGTYLCRISMVNYKSYYTAPITFTSDTQLPAIILQPSNTLLKEVTITARKTFIQQLPDKTIVNVDASISNTGTTVWKCWKNYPA